MVKKLVCAILAALFLLCACSALADRPAVVDDAHLFDSAAVQQMEKIIDRIRQTYQVDAVVLTTTSAPRTSDNDRLDDWADRYYEVHGYGYGPDRAGILFMIDALNRYSCISTAGVMIEYLDQDRIESMMDEAYEHMSDGDYVGGALAVLGRLERYMKAGIKEGSFRYDEVTGERLSGLYNKLTGAELVLSLLAGLGVAGLMILITKAKYSLKGSTYRYDKAANTSVQLSRSDELFLRQHVSRMRKSSNNGSSGGHGGHSGGSAVHRSSGGMVHGGGGRRF